LSITNQEEKNEIAKQNLMIGKNFENIKTTSFFIKIYEKCIAYG